MQKLSVLKMSKHTLRIKAHILYNPIVTLWQLPWQLRTLWLAVKDLEGWELHPVAGKARRENVPPWYSGEWEWEREMDWTLPSCRWVEGEERVSNREDGGQRGTDGWMEGLPLLRFSGGPCFLPVRTEREGGMLIRWLKGKIRSNQTEGEHKVQTDRNPQGVCVSCVCCGQEWTNQRRETRNFLLQRTNSHIVWELNNLSISQEWK